MNAQSDFAAPADLNDPTQLVRECESMAGGMEQQARSAKTGTALGGHPYPDFFYNRVAEVLTAAARTIAKYAPRPDAPAEATPPAPAESPKGSPPAEPARPATKTAPKG